MDISIVIPTYNEEENLEVLYEELKPVMESLNKSYEIIFIDDGSNDKTFKILKSIHAKDKAVKIIKFRKNFGQTAALSAGFENADGDVLISIDSDLQNDPADIPKLLEKLNRGYDLVTGWRHERRDPISKRISSKIANWLREKLIKENIHDSGCTLRAYKKEVVKDLKLYGEMHRYIPALVHAKGFRVDEIKVKHRERKHGKTKYGFTRIAKGFLDLLYIKFWLDYSTRPLHVFGSLGLFQYILSFLIFIEQIIKAVIVKKLELGPLLLLSVLLLITGTLFILFGFLSEIQIRIYYEKIGEKPYDIEVVLK